jgi:hypothetical protein
MLVGPSDLSHAWLDYVDLSVDVVMGRSGLSVAALHFVITVVLVLPFGTAFVFALRCFVVVCWVFLTAYAHMWKHTVGQKCLSV